MNDSERIHSGATAPTVTQLAEAFRLVLERNKKAAERHDEHDRPDNRESRTVHS